MICELDCYKVFNNKIEMVPGLHQEEIVKKVGR